VVLNFGAHLNVLPLIYGLWIAFLAIWLLAATRTKRVARRASGSSLAVQIGLTVPGAVLMFDSNLSVGFLGFRFLPDVAALAYLGVAITAAGIAFAVWARFVLGQNWSSQVTVKQGHELIRRGPYALVRHPIYSGLLLGLFGTAIGVGELRGLIALAFFIVAWWLKARTEETLMIEQFGEQYRQYRRDVKALIPFVL
jgi:protein-S-isoprenylcysteine O-methyltransferase Ste14